MKKVLTILGARPQFIKAAAVSRIIGNKKPFQEIILHTGQHFDYNMSEIFFDEMDIPRPQYNLEINNMGHGAMTGFMIQRIEEILMEERPDIVIVYGDTNSTLAGALAASKLHIKIAHVEAGLRSFNMMMPEEINRILTDRISHLLFCPTSAAVNNLQKEGYDNFDAKVLQVGDIMYDAVLYYDQKSSLKSDIIHRLKLKNRGYVICTVHRQENTDIPGHLSEICSALNEINQFSQVILPLHPRTRKIIQNNHIHLAFNPIEPVGYFDMMQLLKHCSLVITDSGGMQKEAYFFNKYCITMRDQTEWTELVDHGYNQLTGCNKTEILKGYHHFTGKTIEKTTTLYGKGNASELVVESILTDIS